MQVTVFGTSNSLMTRGWVNMIAEEAQRHGIRIDNQSLGGSSSRYGAFMSATYLAEVDYDAIVYDYTIPDHMLLDGGCIAARDILGHYLTIARELIQHRALNKALFLLLPRRTELAGSVMLDQTRDLLASLGLAFLDVRPVLFEIMAETGMTEEDLYLDPRHFVPEVQRRIGQRILDLLQEMPHCRCSAHAPAAAVLGTLPQAGYLALQMDLPTVRDLTTHGTSLISFPTLHIQHGETLRVSGARYLIGAMIWTHDASGSLTLYGKGDAIGLCLRRTFRNIFLFDSLTTPLELGSEGRAVAVKDPYAPVQKALGLVNQDDDKGDATCEIAFLLGCNIPPQDYLAIFEQACRSELTAVDRPGLVQQITRFLRGLARQ